MGGIVTKVVQKIDEKISSRNDAESLMHIQKFVKTILEISNAKVVANLLLNDKNCSGRFMNFLLATSTFSEPPSRNSVDDLHITMNASSSSNDVTSITEGINNLAMGAENSQRQVIERDSLNDNKDELFLKIAVDSLPTFLSSNYFRDWLTDEFSQYSSFAKQSKSLCTTIPDIILADSNFSSQVNMIVPTTACFKELNNNAILCENPSIILEVDPNRNLNGTAEAEVVCSPISPSQIDSKDTAEETLANIDHLELPMILNSDSWLFILLAAMEKLPICFTLATASKQRYGFPLVYVNKYFETFTGYTRSDILGENCRFMQRNEYGQYIAEQCSISTLSCSLKHANPTIVKITNFKKNGQQFRNFVAMKPIFDINGVYRYVASVQLDITLETMDLGKTRSIADALMKLVPNFIWSSDLD